MYFLYLDHSGEVTDPNQKHLTLAGISVFERQTYWISEEIEKIAARFSPSDPSTVELHARQKTQKGLFIFDKAGYEREVQKLALQFKTIGHAWGVTRNIAEVPLFLDSRASRLIQAADAIAWAINRKYERGECECCEIKSGRFSTLDYLHSGFEYYPYTVSDAAHSRPAINS